MTISWFHFSFSGKVESTVSEVRGDHIITNWLVPGIYPGWMGYQHIIQITPLKVSDLHQSKKSSISTPGSRRCSLNGVRSRPLRIRFSKVSSKSVSPTSTAPTRRPSFSSTFTYSSPEKGAQLGCGRRASHEYYFVFMFPQWSWWLQSLVIS